MITINTIDVFTFLIDEDIVHPYDPLIVHLVGK